MRSSLYGHTVPEIDDILNVELRYTGVYQRRTEGYGNRVELRSIIPYGGLFAQKFVIDVRVYIKDVNINVTRTITVGEILREYDAVEIAMWLTGWSSYMYSGCLPALIYHKGIEDPSKNYE